jgi:hypothetical protein
MVALDALITCGDKFVHKLFKLPARFLTRKQFPTLYCCMLSMCTKTIPYFSTTRLETPLGKQKKTGFQVVTMVVMKSSVFWEVTQHSPFKSYDVLEEYAASIFRDEE